MNEIYIYDEIGPDWYGLISAKLVMGELSKYKSKPVTIRVNSPGGSVVEAQAIYNALRRHSDDGGKVTIEVDALAASAASFIAMAGDEVNMAANAMMMIHKAWTFAAGNADDMRSQADILDKFDGVLADTYAARSDKGRDEIMRLLEAETWLTAAEAVELGLADAIGQELKTASACIKPGRYAKTPEHFITGSLPREEKRQATIERVAREIALGRKRLGV
jgi:ATP-dependent Clp protease protease subunit